jgi:hypothetical protein
MLTTGRGLKKSQILSLKMEEGLQNGSQWLDSADSHKLVKLEVVDGVSILSFFLDKDTPGKVRYRNKGAKHVVPIAEFISKVLPSLSLEIERLSIRKWKVVADNGSNRQEAIDELLFQTSPNERQLKDRVDLTKYADLLRRIFEKLFHVWQEVADGPRTTTWTSGRSTDCLNYFCAWLICLEPTGSKAQFFLDASDQQIRHDLDTNYLEYTDPITDPERTEYYLKGGVLSDVGALTCFRERWPSLTMASSSDDC